MNMATAIAPAKLILSGEHAVVYGNPAIAVAINIFTTTTAVRREQHGIHFHLPNLDYTKLVTVQTLRGLKKRLKEKYIKFTQGEAQVKDILQTPFDLAQFVMINTLDYVKASLENISISTKSDLPTGCGLGSSAATSLSVIFAITKLLKTEISKQEYFTLGQAAEKLQHGYASGLDIRIILNGGCIRFYNDIIEKLPIAFPQFTLINTGRPATSTGECVAYVKKHFADNQLLWQAFAEVTNHIANELSAPTVKLLDYIFRNHELLCEIGVVPNTVANFIDDCYANGMAAKISGAGAVQGEQAGMVWVYQPQTEILQTLCDKYGYTMQTAQLCQEGIRT